MWWSTHTLSGWSALHLTPDVHTAAQRRPHLSQNPLANHLCEKHLIYSPSSFLIPPCVCVYDCVCVWLCVCISTPVQAHPAPPTQASSCHTINSLHMGLFHLLSVSIMNFIYLKTLFSLWFSFFFFKSSIWKLCFSLVFQYGGTSLQLYVTCW